jgi:hypothetical protein
MKKIKEKRELLINNKIFTKDDLISLIKLYITLSNSILEKSKEIKRQEMLQEGWKEFNITERYINTSHSGLEFTSSDNLKHSFTFEEIPDAINILEYKNIVEINFYFTENVLNSKFVLNLRYSDSFLNTSQVLVEGEDKDWVIATIGSLQNFLDDCKNQTAFVDKYKILIISVTILTINLFLYNLIEYFIRTKVMFPKIVGNLFNESLIYVIIVLSLISVTPAILGYRRIKNLFPSIEIQTGKYFLHAETEKRFKLLLMASIVIVPALLSFLLMLM